jgi:hypothetical protein
MNHCVSKSPAYTVIDFVSLCVQERVAILIINGHAVLVTARPIIPRGHYSISRSIIASTAVSNNPTGSKWRYPATIPTAKSATVETTTVTSVTTTTSICVGWTDESH